MKHVTELSSDLKAVVQMSTLEKLVTAVKPITETYLKGNYAKYFIFP